MSAYKKILPATVLAALTVFCSTQPLESVLTWTIPNYLDNSSVFTDVHFTRETLATFLSCLCRVEARECTVVIDTKNSTFLRHSFLFLDTRLRPLTSMVRFVCSHELPDQLSRIACTRVVSSDDEICSETHNCARYVTNDSFIAETFPIHDPCDFPFIELSTAPNLTIIPTPSDDAVNIVSLCEVGCSIHENSTANTSTTPNTAASFNSDFTDKNIIFATLAVGLVISFVQQL